MSPRLTPGIERFDAPVYQSPSIQPYLRMDSAAQRQAFMRAARTIAASNGWRNDSPESIYLNRQLEALWNTVYTVKRAPLVGMELVPRDTETPAWAEGYRFRYRDMVGAAVLMKSYREQIPSVNVASNEEFGRIWGYATKFGWSVLEAQQAQATGINLQQDDQASARRILDERTDDAIAFGESELGTYGLLNNPNVPIYTIPDNENGDPEFDLKTGREVVNNLNALVEKVKRQSNDTEYATTIVMPPGALSYIATTPWSDNDGTTILDYFLKAHPEIQQVRGWNKCNDAGVGGTPRMVAYAQTPDHLRAVIPLLFTMLPPQQVDFLWHILAHIRVGGVQWMFPLSAVYADSMISTSLLS
jgi:hypothetical protein